MLANGPPNDELSDRGSMGDVERFSQETKTRRANLRACCLSLVTSDNGRMFRVMAYPLDGAAKDGAGLFPYRDQDAQPQPGRGDDDVEGPCARAKKDEGRVRKNSPQAYSPMCKHSIRDMGVSRSAEKAGTVHCHTSTCLLDASIMRSRLRVLERVWNSTAEDEERMLADHIEAFKSHSKQGIRLVVPASTTAKARRGHLRAGASTLDASHLSCRIRIMACT